MVTLLILNIGTFLSVGFEKILLLYNPLTYETADVISTYLYRVGLVSNNFCYATAIGLVRGGRRPDADPSARTRSRAACWERACGEPGDRNQDRRHQATAPRYRVFQVFNVAVLLLVVVLVTLYPFLNIVAQSFSSEAAISAGKVNLFPGASTPPPTSW